MITRIPPSISLQGLVISNTIGKTGITINSDSGRLYSLKILFPIRRIMGHYYFFVPSIYEGQIIMKSVNRFRDYKGSMCDLLHNLVWKKRILRQKHFEEKGWMPHGWHSRRS